MIKFRASLGKSGMLAQILFFFGLALFIGISVQLTYILLTGYTPDDSNPSKVFQLVESLGLFILPSYITALSIWEKPIQQLGITRIPNYKLILLLSALTILLIPFINLCSSLNELIKLPPSLGHIEKWMMEMEARSQLITENMLNSDSSFSLLINTSVIAVVPAIGEELFFRGIFLQIIGKKKPNHLSVWITAFVFSAIHLQFYGFLPRLLLGAVLGYLFIWSRNLWLPIVVHFINNFVVIITYFLKSKGINTHDFETIGTENTYWIGIVSVFIASFGLIRIYKIIKSSSKISVDASEER